MKTAQRNPPSLSTQTAKRTAYAQNRLLYVDKSGISGPLEVFEGCIMIAMGFTSWYYLLTVSAPSCIGSCLFSPFLFLSQIHKMLFTQDTPLLGQQALKNTNNHIHDLNAGGAVNVAGMQMDGVDSTKPPSCTNEEEVRPRFLVPIFSVEYRSSNMSNVHRLFAPRSTTFYALQARASGIK